MTNKYVVGYDGSEASKRALNYAKDLAEKMGASLVVAYVLEWSPYSFLTPEELEERHMRRKEELSRAEEHVIAPIKGELGDDVEYVIKYGDIANTMSSIADEKGAVAIIVGKSGDHGLAQRFFGSSASKLIQIANVACVVVP